MQARYNRIMARNVEIKARARNFARQLELARGFADEFLGELVQEDTFFRVSFGRLKLREFLDRPAELIQYHRPDTTSPATSEYHKVSVEDAEGLKNALRESLGIQVVVKKRRWVYLSGPSRLHFDRVQDLGEFLEIEVVLREGESAAEGCRKAEILMTRLEILPDDLFQESYVDLGKSAGPRSKQSE